MGRTGRGDGRGGPRGTPPADRGPDAGPDARAGARAPARPGGRQGPPPSARAAAARLLGQVLIDRQPLEDADTALAPLPPEGRARALRLARTTLRHLDRADATLAPFLASAPPDAVRMVLRLAVVEHFVDAAPAHAVVNDAVAQVRARRGGTRLAGMANAVLRRALATPPQDWAARPVQRLPEWLRTRLVRAWGTDAVAAIEAAHAQGAATDLTLRAAADGADGARMAAALGATALPTGSLRLARGAGRISGLPGHAEGAFWVQDAAAALPARMLAPQPGARVLDLCAAPGGKTLQLAAAGAAVTALDLSEARLARLHDNLARTGLSARVVAADALTWQPQAPFDAILLDAPCTATGTIRRHPDLPHLRTEAGLHSLLALQAALIDRALGWLVPGGRLVYATCSLLPEEGEDQIAAALARHPGLAVAPATVPGAEPGWRAPGGGLRLRPDSWPAWGGIDGFFIAALHRPASDGGTGAEA